MGFFPNYALLVSVVLGGPHLSKHFYNVGFWLYMTILKQNRIRHDRLLALNFIFELRFVICGFWVNEWNKTGYATLATVDQFSGMDVGVLGKNVLAVLITGHQ